MEPFYSGESKKIFRNISCIALIGLTASGKYAWQEEETRKYSSTVLNFQGQLCISELFKDIKDAILLILHYSTMVKLIPIDFFEYILSCRMCNQSAFDHQFWIDTRRSKFEQQTDNILPACRSHGQNHKDPETIDLSKPRRAQYLHKAWQRHQDAVYWVDINLAWKKGLKFYQTRSNAIILQETLPAYCIAKVVRMETGEITYERVFASPRLPPKISLKHEWKRELSSEHVQRPEVGQLEVSNRTNQF